MLRELHHAGLLDDDESLRKAQLRRAGSTFAPDGGRGLTAMIGRIIGLIVVGLIVGALGRLVHPGPRPDADLC